MHSNKVQSTSHGMRQRTHQWWLQTTTMYHRLCITHTNEHLLRSCALPNHFCRLHKTAIRAQPGSGKPCCSSGGRSPERWSSAGALRGGGGAHHEHALCPPRSQNWNEGIRQSLLDQGAVPAAPQYPPTLQHIYISHPPHILLARLNTAVTPHHINAFVRKQLREADLVEQRRQCE